MGTIRLNKKVVGGLLKSNPVRATVDAEAPKIAAEAGPNATVDHYTTDRAVAGVVVPAIDQARDGALTKAVGKRGGSLE